LLVLGLVATPFVAQSGSPISVFARFFTVGSLVFGGGHVVLPLLQAQVVPQGWVSDSAFIAGYGAAQAVPGPLFTFAAYLGAVMHGPVHGVSGAALALIAIFLPSFLLIGRDLAVLEPSPIEPGRHRRPSRRQCCCRRALDRSALSTDLGHGDPFIVGSGARAGRLSLLQVWKVQQWMVVAFSAAGAAALAQFN
jgi:chromate transporter